ncbi:histidine kinase [Meiothermus sp. PNK-Is4]|uniref:histidine kinase n=1 Tax=Meiothermus sp. PNK-Is4 TaxID=2740565 RepID=UPI00101E9F0E|nr:histidine kinase [Meiothermus sp. PNK-Is4]RYM39436.1 histidine kinase [Meiothermus sp. PNK-Is4]
MSTKAQIVVEDLQTIKLYKHSDGYPSGVLPVLEPCVEAFLQRRGWDPEYLLAQVVMAFGLTQERHRQTQFLGYGLSDEWYADIEWVYRVRRDGSIEVRRTKESWWDAAGKEEDALWERHTRLLTGEEVAEWQKAQWAEEERKAMRAFYGLDEEVSCGASTIP